VNGLNRGKKGGGCLQLGGGKKDAKDEGKEREKGPTSNQKPEKKKREKGGAPYVLGRGFGKGGGGLGMTTQKLGRKKKNEIWPVEGENKKKERQNILGCPFVQKKKKKKKDNG